MPRARDPNRDKAYEIYKEHNALIDLVEIASQLNVPPGSVRGWKNKDRWDDQMNGTFQSKVQAVKGTERKGNGTERKKKEKKLPKVQLVTKKVKNIIENSELNDKQKLFCIFFAKSFNATRSYQKAYGCTYNAAMVSASQLLMKPNIKAEIERIKEERYTQAYLSKDDIFQKYMDIAFSDVTDFLEFGREEVQVMGAFGPVTVKNEQTGEEKPVTKVINTVRFKESSEIDGSLIGEVKQGKDGASIKLADRMKALDWLAAHMDLATEEQRARIAVLKKQGEADQEADKTIHVVIDDSFKTYAE